MGNSNSGPPAPYDFIQCPADQLNANSNCCNGLSGLCDFPVSEVMFATSHNAMSSREGGLPILYNNLFELEDALETGYRGIGVDVCNCNGRYQLCHGICYIGARKPEEVFGSIVNFLEANPTEIIVVTLQVDSGADEPVSLNDFHAQLASTVPKVLDMLYVHPEGATSWPTLGELKSLGKRVLFFHHEGPSDCSNGKCPDGFHYWFQYAAETKFSFRNVAELRDSSNSCLITRGGSSTMDFFAVNAFTTPASQSDAEVINEKRFLENHINMCSLYQGGMGVNFINVDFWSIAKDLPELVQEKNTALIEAANGL